MTVELVSCCYERGNFSFPLGALCVQEALRQAGIPSHLSNCYLSDDPRKAASRISADVVGISVYLWNRSWFDQFVTALKKRNPQVILFAGGTEVTGQPDELRPVPVPLPHPRRRGRKRSPSLDGDQGRKRDSHGRRHRHQREPAHPGMP
ncbi:MAG: cobalamin-dependent protein [Sphaerochaeta sp.]|nr:cobalamin-dependent protein [Sphaerochaeta sp.]